MKNIKYYTCITIHLQNLGKGPGRKKEHCGCSVHSSFVYYKPQIFPWQPFQSSHVPTATVTAFHREEGHRHSCELLLLQTEKHLNWRLQFSTEWVCWNTTLQATGTTHTAQKWHQVYWEYLTFLCCLAYFIPAFFKFCLEFLCICFGEDKIFFHYFYCLTTLNSSNLEERYPRGSFV